jgi:hypothetical protein
MKRSIGPFWAAGQAFVVESEHDPLLDQLEDRLRDLLGRPPEHDDAQGEPTVFSITRGGPGWLSHPWALFRDGAPCESTVTDDYIVPYVLWEVTRLVLDTALPPIVPLHAAALARDGRAVALVGASHSGKSTLAAWMTRNGWGFLTDEVTLLDTTDVGRPVVQPFWRPIGVRRPGPLDAHIGHAGDGSELLLPASVLGDLAGPTLLAALVCPTYTPGSTGQLAPLSPARVLTMVARQLPSLRRDGAAVFHALAEVVARVPAFSVEVDDLDIAVDQLAELVASTPSELPS